MRSLTFSTPTPDHAQNASLRLKAGNRLITAVIGSAGQDARKYQLVRLLKILALMLLVGVGFFIFANLWFDSQESQKSYYATAGDAERDKVDGADAFDRGWLPVVLKSGASEIREEHNVSTNRGPASFHYAAVFVDEVQRSCSPFAQDAPVSSPFRRWPDFLRNGDTGGTLRSRKIKTFQCGDFTFAINDAQSGFFWH